MKVYTVGSNMPGYLPDSDPCLFTSKREALEYLADLKAELEEAGEDRYVTWIDGPFICSKSDWEQYKRNGRILSLAKKED